MDRRSRFAAFGTAALLVVVGIVCAVLVAGTVGGILALVLIGLGLVLATGLVFFEVGLSEDRERAREERQREHVDRVAKRKARPKPSDVRPKLGRSRGHRRHLDH